MPALHIGVQAVLALYASWAAAERRDTERGGVLTGVVVDSGDGCTHVIPVVDGFVISSTIASVPLAGRDVTQHVQQLLRDRGATVPPDQSLEAARCIKESFCYVCSGAGFGPGLSRPALPHRPRAGLRPPPPPPPTDPAKEGAKMDAEAAKYTRRYEGVSRAGTPFAVDVLRERYLGPELLFAPDTYRGSGAQAMRGQRSRRVLREPAAHLPRRCVDHSVSPACCRLAHAAAGRD